MWVILFFGSRSILCIGRRPYLSKLAGLRGNRTHGRRDTRLPIGFEGHERHQSLSQPCGKGRRILTFAAGTVTAFPKSSAQFHLLVTWILSFSDRRPPPQGDIIPLE